MSSQFSFNAAVLTLNLTNDMTDSELYKVEMANTGVKDGSNQVYAGISVANYQFQMEDDTVPTLSTYNLARATNGVTVAGRRSKRVQGTRC